MIENPKPEITELQRLLIVQNRQTLFSNESFLLGMLQVVDVAVLGYAIEKHKELVEIFKTLDQNCVLTCLASPKFLIISAAVSLILALWSALYRHDYKMWDVKANPSDAQVALDRMRNTMRWSVIAITTALGSVISLILLS